MINTIEYKNEQREEMIKYYYSQKNIYNNDMDLFLADVSRLEKYNIVAGSFKELGMKIPVAELEHFFKDAKIANCNMMTSLNFEEDWNLINTFIETEKYFILRIWSTTA